MLIREAEVAGRRVDLRISEQRVAEIGTSLPRCDGEPVLEARGGALIPALQDHHLHLQALAAAMESVDCGPAAVGDAAKLARALADATPGDGWIRGTGYFESVAGPLDRERLDALAPERPVRIQHRSGSMWFVNGKGLARLGLTGAISRELQRAGVEVDDAGHATGRFFRADEWLRARWTRKTPPDLSPVGRRLAGFGIATVTDATPTNGPDEWARFGDAQATGALPQHVIAMGRRSLSALASTQQPTPVSAGPTLRVGAHKILLDEPALPDLEALGEAIRGAHDDGRPVAIHTVTRAELLFALAAFDEVGARSGDRLEHASVAPEDAMERIGARGLTVVTQPGFVFERGDAYRRDVAAIDQPHLYRLRSWLDRGIPLAGGTDAPFGDPDPWRAIRAAVDRRTRDGATLGPGEGLSPEAAVGLFLPRMGAAARATDGEAPAPGPGDPADLCLLRLPWSAFRGAPSAEAVAATLRAGQLIHS